LKYIEKSFLHTLQAIINSVFLVLQQAMDVDKKLSMSLDDLIKKTRSDKPKKFVKKGGNKKDQKQGKKANKVVVSKKGKLGVRKTLKKTRRNDEDGDTKMTNRKETDRRRKVIRRVSTGGKQDSVRKFSRKVVVKAGPNAPADIRRKVKITNIPYDLKWQDVKDAMSSVGRIERCDVEHGEAILLFSNHKEALRAVQTYHNGDMNGRKIRVFFI
jgi:RNA recognition motif-containing protein